MGTMQAMIGIVILVIVLVVFIPITQELLPSIGQYSGATVAMMVGSTVVVIIAVGLYMFMQESMNRHADIQGV